MYEVDKNNAITMIKGDTVILDLKFFDQEDAPYVPKEGDRIRFALKKRYDDSEPLLVKDIPIDTLQLVIEPKDTKNLPCRRIPWQIQIRYRTDNSRRFC